MDEQNIKYISLSQAAELTNYSQDYISLLCRQEKLKGVKIGRNWVTTKEWVEDYIDKTKGSGQNIVPVEVKKKNFSETGKKINSSNALAGGGMPLAARKPILATIICSIFVSGFVFLQLGFQQGIINPDLALTLQRAPEKLISFGDSLGDSLDDAKNKSAKFAVNKIIAASDSLDGAKNETAKSSAREILAAGNFLDAVKNKSAKFAVGAIIALDWNLKSANDNAGKFLAAGENNLKESVGGCLTGAENNLDNFTDSLRAKLAGLSKSKDIIFSAALNNADNKKQSMAAGAFDESSDNPKNAIASDPERSGGAAISDSDTRDCGIGASCETGAGIASVVSLTRDDNIMASASSHFSNKIITLSDSLNIVKSETAKFAVNKIIAASDSLDGAKNKAVKLSNRKIAALSGSLSAIKNKTARFAINEIDKLYYSCELIKNKSEEKIRIALGGFGAGGEAVEKSPVAAGNPEKTKTKESVDKLEQEIMGDIQKRFDEFRGEQAYLLPASQNYGAAIVPYSDEEDKKKKIENLKESFSDEVSVEEDEGGETGTIVPNIPGADEQRYLYLMVPMGE